MANGHESLQNHRYLQESRGCITQLSLSHDQFYLFTKRPSVCGEGSTPFAVCTDMCPLARLCVLRTAKPADRAAPSPTSCYAIPAGWGRRKEKGRKSGKEEGVAEGAGRWEEQTSREGREKAEKKEEKGEEMKDKGRREHRPGRRGGSQLGGEGRDGTGRDGTRRPAGHASPGHGAGRPAGLGPGPR